MDSIGRKDLIALTASKQFADKTWADFELFKSRNPSWITEDHRLNFISAIAVTATCHYSDQLLFHKKGKTEQWIINNLEIHDLDYFRVEYGNQIGYSNFIKNCIVVESRLRVFLRALDQGACNEGYGPFENIIKWTLKRLCLETHLDTLLFKELRNLIHNNGIYFHKSKKNKGPYIFLNKSYEFIHGKRPDSHVYSVTTDLVSAVYEIMIEIINHEDISKIQII